MKVVEERVRAELCSPSSQDNSVFSNGLRQVGRIGVTVSDGHQTVRERGPEVNGGCAVQRHAQSRQHTTRVT